MPTSLVLAATVYWLAQSDNLGDSRNLNGAHTDAHFATVPYASVADWKARIPVLQRQIRTAAGLFPWPARNNLNARRFGSLVSRNVRIENYAIETLPGFRLAGNLYLPVRAKGKLPAILVPHGHWKHGRIEHRPDYSVPALCLNLAAQGYVAFAYDMVGYNDTLQLPHSFGETQAEQLWSFHPLGIQLWNSIRAVDFLTSLPEVDARRIGVTGASGGGTQAFLLAAVDSRIAAAAPVDMVSHTFQGDDACEMAPGLRVDTNNVEIAAMMAPKPLLLISSTRDWTRSTPSAEFPAIQSIYRLYGAAASVSYAHIDAKHNYNRESREAAYRFFCRSLLGKPFSTCENVPEKFEPEFELTRLLLPPEAATGLAQGEQAIFEIWRNLSQARNQTLTAETLREVLSALVGYSPGTADPTLLAFGGKLALDVTPLGHRIPVRHLPGSQPGWILLVGPDGAESAIERYLKESKGQETRSILALDVFQKGAAASPRSLRGDHLVFHRSDDANRVLDIAHAVEYLAASSSEPVTITCSGHAGFWCLMAAAITPHPTILNVDEQVHSGNDDDLRRWLFIPGLQQAGGFAAIQRRLGTRSPARAPVVTSDQVLD